MRAIGVLENDGWLCVECPHPYYCGRLTDYFNHRARWHDDGPFTLDGEKGVVWDGLREMACSTGGDQ